VVLRRVFWVDPFIACPRTARSCDQSVETESSVDMGRYVVPPGRRPRAAPRALTDSVLPVPAGPASAEWQPIRNLHRVLVCRLQQLFFAPPFQIAGGALKKN